MLPFWASTPHLHPRGVQKVSSTQSFRRISSFRGTGSGWKLPLGTKYQPGCFQFKTPSNGQLDHWKCVIFLCQGQWDPERIPGSPADRRRQENQPGWGEGAANLLVMGAALMGPACESTRKGWHQGTRQVQQLLSTSWSRLWFHTCLIFHAPGADSAHPLQLHGVLPPRFPILSTSLSGSLVVSRVWDGMCHYVIPQLNWVKIRGSARQRGPWQCQ